MPGQARMTQNAPRRDAKSGQKSCKSDRRVTKSRARQGKWKRACYRRRGTCSEGKWWGIFEPNPVMQKPLKLLMMKTPAPPVRFCILLAMVTGDTSKSLGMGEGDKQANWVLTFWTGWAPFIMDGDVMRWHKDSGSWTANGCSRIFEGGTTQKTPSSWTWPWPTWADLNWPQAAVKALVRFIEGTTF